jgi:hypothetical protein
MNQTDLIIHLATITKHLWVIKQSRSEPELQQAFDLLVNLILNSKESSCTEHAQTTQSQSI